MTQAYNALNEQMQKIADLQHLDSITKWDEAVNMPSGGGEARAQALSTLSAMIHDLNTQPQIAQFIEQAKSEDLDPWQKKNLELIEKRYRKSIDVPSDLVSKATRASMNCEQRWRELRAANNWNEFKPLLQETFELAREIAVIQGESLNLSPYDAAIDQFSPGFNQAIIDPIFTELKSTLPDMITSISEAQALENVIEPTGPFALSEQRQFGLELMQALGFDFNHGRLDVSHHPFCGGVPSDVRITTRYNEDEFLTAMMGIVHETGHARYEQGLPAKWRDQPVGRALGMAVHESQSLLVEMYACRSKAFMEFSSPLIKRHFGDHSCYNADNLFALHSRVKPGYIRVDADEVTYPLHVILRYDIEKKLFNDELTINDLPDAWNEAMQQFFKLSTQDNYHDGVMQDVHWPAGIFGYFPAYTLGSIIAAQLYTAANNNHPEISDQIAQGNFTTLFNWLNQHVHARASSVTPEQILNDATGSNLSTHCYLEHIKNKYNV